jgi:hypothetical protein
MRARPVFTILATACVAGCTLLTGAGDFTIGDGQTGSSASSSGASSSGDVEGGGPGDEAGNDGAVDPPGSTRIKDITFENGSLTHPVTGVDVASSNTAIFSSFPLDGTRSARLDTGGYVEEDLPVAADIYVSLLVRFEAVAAERILYVERIGAPTIDLHVELADGGNHNLVLRSGGSSVGSSTNVTAGPVYRIAFRYRTGTGGLTFHFVPFGQALGSGSGVSGGGPGTPASRLIIGGRAGGGTKLVIDNVRIDRAVMPEQ